MIRTAVIALGLALAGAYPSFSMTIHNPYTSFWVLGDSLSDNGSTLPLGSVSSDGDVWNDGILDEFQKAGKTARNLAYGGAKAAGGSPIDLGQQLVDFAVSAEPKGARPLVSLWFGGNDLLPDPGGPLLGNFTPQNALTAAFAIDTAIDALMLSGVSDFLVFSLPDLGAIPLTANLPAIQRGAATQLSSVFNATLASLFPAAANVTFIDVFSLTQAVAQQPNNQLGFTSNGLCRFDPTLDCQDTPFWDPVHPSSAAHALIEAEVRAQLAAVPLPAGGWLLLTALVLVAGCNRRA